jgi:hypothetical protein
MGGESRGRREWSAKLVGLGRVRTLD